MCWAKSGTEAASKSSVCLIGGHVSRCGKAWYTGYVRTLAILFCAAALHGQEWKPLFDGKTLDGWRVTEFKRRVTPKVEDGKLILTAGAPMTGVTLAKPFPKSNYEVRFEAARILGGDFFASLTFPVKESHATLVTGGWGGDIVGMSSINGWDASENETRSYFSFENDRWYKFRLRVTDDRVQAWIDDEPVFNVEITGREISLRIGEIELSAPFGFASYNTTGALRKIEYRALAPPGK